MHYSMAVKAILIKEKRKRNAFVFLLTEDKRKGMCYIRYNPLGNGKFLSGVKLL